jgi:hypothetical protein
VRSLSSGISVCRQARQRLGVVDVDHHEPPVRQFDERTVSVAHVQEMDNHRIRYLASPISGRRRTKGHRERGEMKITPAFAVHGRRPGVSFQSAKTGGTPVSSPKRDAPGFSTVAEVILALSEREC